MHYPGRILGIYEGKRDGVALCTINCTDDVWPSLDAKQHFALEQLHAREESRQETDQVPSDECPHGSLYPQSHSTLVTTPPGPDLPWTLPVPSQSSHSS